MSYERTIIHGVPFYARDGILYAWDDDHISAGKPLRLGTGNSKTETLTLDDTWSERAKPLLDTWRAGQVHRSRALLRTAAAATAPTKRKRRTANDTAVAEPEPEPEPEQEAE